MADLNYVKKGRGGGWGVKELNHLKIFLQNKFQIFFWGGGSCRGST